MCTHLRLLPCCSCALKRIYVKWRGRNCLFFIWLPHFLLHFAVVFVTVVGRILRCVDAQMLCHFMVHSYWLVSRQIIKAATGRQMIPPNFLKNLMSVAACLSWKDHSLSSSFLAHFERHNQHLLTMMFDFFPWFGIFRLRQLRRKLISVSHIHRLILLVTPHSSWPQIEVGMYIDW